MMNFIMTPKDQQLIRRTLWLLYFLFILLIVITAISVAYSAGQYFSSRDFGLVESRVITQMIITIPLLSLFIIVLIACSRCLRRLAKMPIAKQQPEQQRGHTSDPYVSEGITPTNYTQGSYDPYNNRLAEG